MGVFQTCSNSLSYTSIIYIMSIIMLITIGILYEINVIKRTKEYEKESVWLYGFIILLFIAFSMSLIHFINFKFQISKKNNTQSKLGEISKYFWFFSHIIAHGLVTLVSPGQWPFWLAIGIAWEWFECYTICFNKYGIPIGCSGMYDIIANIAGISLAIWIHNSYKIKGLYKRNSKLLKN